MAGRGVLWYVVPVVLALGAPVAWSVEAPTRDTGQLLYEGSSRLDGSFHGRCDAKGFHLSGPASLTLLGDAATFHGRHLWLNETDVQLWNGNGRYSPRWAEPPQVTTRALDGGLLRIHVGPQGFVGVKPRELHTSFPVRLEEAQFRTEPTALSTGTPAGDVLRGEAWDEHNDYHFFGWNRPLDADRLVGGPTDLRLYLRDAIVEAGPRTIETGPYREEVWGLQAPTLGVRTLRVRDAFLDVEGARFGTEDPVRLACARLDGRVDGRWSATDVTGRLEAGEDAWALQGQDLMVEGAFTLSEAAQVDATTGPANPRGETRSNVDGEFRNLAIGGAAQVVRRAEVAHVVGWAAVVAALAALAIKAGSQLWGVLGARLDPGSVLRNPARHRIHELVRTSPGLDLSALAHETGTHVSTIAYHVLVLSRAGLVGTRRHRHSVRVLPRDVLGRDALAGVVGALEPPFAFLAQRVSASPLPVSQAAALVAERFGISRRSAYATVTRAVALGVVRRTGPLRGGRLEPARPS